MNTDTATLVAFMRPLKGWWKASEISNVYYLRKGIRLSDRKIRALAAESGGKLVSAPGGKGYKHRANCTQAEIAEAASRLRSQAKAMNRKARLIERA